MEYVECTRKLDGKKFTALEVPMATNLWYVITEWDVLSIFSYSDFEELFEINKEK